MRPGVERDHRAHQRGLVMGLTMAEVMVLVLFALLLILGWRSQAADDPTVEDALPGLREAAGFDSGASWIPDDFEKLTIYAAVGRAVTAALGPDSRRDRAELAKEAAALTLLGKQTQEAFGRNKMEQTPRKATDDFVQRAGTTFNDSYRTGNYGSSTIWIDSLLRCSKNCDGNGLELPPCATMPNGRPAYVFRATLRTNAVMLHDNRWPHLEGAKKAWPISTITFDEELSDMQFREQTNPMFQWSRERGCRFFVEIADETGPAEKVMYIARLRTVEEHFYKFLLQ